MLDRVGKFMKNYENIGEAIKKAYPSLCTLRTPTEKGSFAMCL